MGHAQHTPQPSKPTRTLTGSPEINGKVSRAHTLPRASTKSCAKNEPQSPSLTRIKENTFSEWMLTKAIQFSPTHQINNWDEKNHYSTVLTRDLNTLVTLDGCHSKPDSVRMSASDAIKCATEAIPSSAIAGLDMENGTPGRDVNTLNDVQEVPGTIAAMHNRNKPGPDVAQRPSKTVVSTYMCKRYSRPFDAPNSPSEVAPSLNPDRPESSICFITELNEAVSKIRAKK
ncbi:hypothetical protein D915_006632 [Fasciola hepatica]|uniref:Uncharacterized protein n=1 Tax=Fasciola hepatica TaxID=6192 RepID=A0A4E0RZS6_FASHE|nr:hypothetical protein D915_006632 [Fasciola hepatica]